MLVSDMTQSNVSSPSLTGLNPCFSGCWSRTKICFRHTVSTQVLILVLVDVGLGLLCTPDLDYPTVLILVLVDVGLGPLVGRI